MQIVYRCSTQLLLCCIYIYTYNTHTHTTSDPIVKKLNSVVEKREWRRGRERERVGGALIGSDITIQPEASDWLVAR